LGWRGERLREYKVERLVPPKSKISGKLLAFEGKVVFEPHRGSEGRVEIPVAKIRDVRFATEKEVSALRVLLLKPVLGVLWKKKHKMLLMDFEDKFGIIQHLTFEGGKDIENAEKELYELRKAEKLKLE
jgi:hypothetical protein